jgi:hypothetical protein
LSSCHHLPNKPAAPKFSNRPLLPEEPKLKQFADKDVELREVKRLAQGHSADKGQAGTGLD